MPNVDIDLAISEGYKISKNLELPSEAATWVNAILAKRGSGKTYDACVFAEELLEAGIPIVVIDGMGVWWGLRVSKDGHEPGLPIVVFGGAHADIVLAPDKAALIARSIVESGISAIIDISQMSKNQSRRVVGDFLFELYRRNQNAGIRHIFIEEADLWAPQKVSGDTAYVCGAVDEIVRRGGNFNLGCTLITQRSAVLQKDVLTQADCLIILRTLAPQDKRAIQDWVEEMTDETKSRLKKWYDTLKELRNGEAWVWHPDKPTIFQKVMFRERKTLHATREYLRGPEARKVQMMDVNEYVDRFKKVFEPKPIIKSPIPRPIQVSPEPKLPETKSVTRSITQSPALSDKIIGEGDVIVSFPSTTTIMKEEPMPQNQINQTLPTYVLQRNHIAYQIADPEPSTPLGRLLVVLVNGTDKAGNKKWTLSSLKEGLENHGWDVSEDDLRGVITHLLQTEHLTSVVAGNRIDYKFTGRDRVLIRDSETSEMVA